VIVVVAGLVRLLYLFARGPDSFAGGDTPMYDDIATSLLAGRGFALAGEPTAFRAPGYPLFLAGLYWLFGAGNHLAVQLVQAGLGALTALAVAAIGRELGGARVAWLAGWVVALHPNLVFWTGYLLEENLFVPVFVVAFCLLLRAGRQESARPFALAGLATGAHQLTRPAALAFVAAVPLWLWLSRRARGRAVAVPLATLFLSTALVLAPWTLRNQVVFHRFVPICTCGAGVLWHGTRWDEVGRGGKGVDDPVRGRGLDQFQERTAYLAAFVAYLKAQPLAYLRLAGRKAVAFWSLSFPQHSLRHKLVNAAFFGPLFLFAALGLLLAPAPAAAVRLFWTLLLATTVFHMITLVDYDGRYRLGIEAALPAPAALGLLWLADRLSRRRPPHPAVTGPPLAGAARPSR
jgi:4-amino-4-deoxy-L-arabinose transferase-like glycosyltransferase